MSYNKNGQPRKMNGNALMKTVEAKLGLGNILSHPETGRNIRSDCRLNTYRKFCEKYLNFGK